jgi:signal transduction histidine kinase
VAVSVAIDGAEQLDREQEALVYRVAQEAVRNVIAYADAGSLRVELTLRDGICRLVVSDDGRGFDPAMRERRLAEGHLGLSLVEELARQAGGRLEISSSEGAGTRVELEVPSR